MLLFVQVSNHATRSYNASLIGFVFANIAIPADLANTRAWDNFWILELSPNLGGSP